MKTQTYEQWCRLTNSVGNFEDKRIFEAGREQGIQKVVDYLKDMADAYASEHGQDDPSTGVLEFGSEIKTDYYNSLMELAEELGALK